MCRDYTKAMLRDEEITKALNERYIDHSSQEREEIYETLRRYLEICVRIYERKEINKHSSASDSTTDT